MSWRRTAVLGLIACTAATAVALAVDAAEPSAVERGADWLLAQQQDDGSWRSTTYGQMQSGVGNTALALDALTRMPANWRQRHQSDIDRAFAFLLANLDDDGYVSAPNNAADFPTYATALLLASLERSRPENYQDVRRQLVDYLLKTQRLDEVDANHFGGWPQVGGEPIDAAAESNVNISVSRFVAEGLQAQDGVPDHARAAALKFVDRCRNPDDGGYFFTPAADDPLNKAGQGPAGAPRSYGTTTADAILAQLAWNVPKSDPPMRAALAWLESQPALDVVPAFPATGARVVGAEEALKYYYWAALAQVIAHFPDSKLALHRAELKRIVEAEQHLDGHWQNANPLMREDDPLIATALAITALTNLDETAPE